ncbi:MAG TPA: tripartite tricarboxylate transporter substrate-binding protein [Xanthobacteraceae bacterium]|nr:tripartite tricarboxylate transporter substrate-binding protein [Xanthobacteraceae bacterium]
MTRRLRFALATLVVLVPAAAGAQTWPGKQPIRVIIPFTAGSATDIVARTVMEQVSSQIGQAIVVENRLGAGGTLGIGAVAKADPDGYTFLAHSTSFAVTATTYSNPGYDARRDFSGITALASLPNVLAVTPNKYPTLQDMVAFARANPGKLNYATAGAGSASHLNAERLAMAADIKVQHIPFKGGPDALTEIMAGRVDFYFVPLPPARGLMQGGKIAVLAVSSARRATALPDVPTTVEAGFPNSDYNFWVGLWAPAATPKAIIERMNTETVKALQQPSVREKIANAGGDPLPMQAAEFEAFTQKEIDVNAMLVNAAGMQVN